MTERPGWEALHALFVTRLHARIGLMRETVAQIGPGPSDARTDLQRQFHSLAGIGGTFGYPAITDLAREGEALCASIAAGSAPIAASIEQISRLAADVSR
ncbi:MAG TPA: Hpt domain-containing protein [Thermoanaerobaculia bacterium]|jgi:chemotaxis protein histidine kinase CheA|nr:Hpt domain-containing protein [Thermoanaerobaculia bacterium]